MKNYSLSHKQIATQVSKRYAIFKKNIQKLKKKASIKNTHEVSISLRRLLAMEELFNKLYQLKLGLKNYKKLQSFRKKMNQVRDAQELQIKFKKLKLKTDLALEFLKHLGETQSLSTKKMLRALDTVHFKNLDPRLQKKALLKQLKDQASPSVQSLLNYYFKNAQDLLKKTTGVQKEEALHQIRIQLKNYRYTLEVLDPSQSKPLIQKKIKNLKSIHRLLGDAHDLIVLSEALAKFEKDPASQTYQACQHKIIHWKEDLEDQAIKKLLVFKTKQTNQIGAIHGLPLQQN